LGTTHVQSFLNKEMPIQLNASFWDSKYRTDDMGWDVGHPSPPITDYIDQLDNHNISILIPGCGNGYEAEYLWRSGFTNVYILDLSETAMTQFKIRVPDFPPEQILVGDFFEHQGKYDLVLEQTFFCAINPALRSKYASKMKDLLNKNGKLVGVLFNDDLNTDRPPFGGNPLEYLGYFQPHFNNLYMKNCYNSIEPRMGRELFVIFS